VEGDIAIIQLMVRQMSSLDGGPDEESWVAWTDIMRRDDGEWRWIADHGHVPGGSN
jgi:ketosteroid isomerase-like protein